MNTKVMFSSATDEWSTPQSAFDALNAEFNFDVDVCADAFNTKLASYYSKEDNALDQEWSGVCFMNPPYGEPQLPCKPGCAKKKCAARGYHIHEYIPGVIDWMRKAYESSVRGCTVVCLVPARTDTRWWHEYAMRGEIRFIRGRLKFGGAKSGAPFPSAVVVFRPKQK